MKSKRVIYVLPYEFYFTGKNNSLGGHTSHIIGVVESLTAKGFWVELISDMPVPGLCPRHVQYFPPTFRSVRKNLHILGDLFSKKINDGKERHRRASGLAEDGVLKVVLYFANLLRNHLFLAGLFIATWKRAAKKKCAFLYFRHNLNGYIPAIVSRFYHIPCVVEINTPWSMGDRRPAAGPDMKEKPLKIRRRERIQYKSADVISVVSPVIRDWILTHTEPFWGDKILVNPNGVDPNKFYPTQGSLAIREKFGLNESDILIGMAAVFVRYNAVEELIEAFSIALKKRPALRLMLIGRSELSDQLVDYVCRHDLSGRVIFTGRVPHDVLPRYLATCDILASHFNFHGIVPHICSIKHLEYMAMGKAVIATDAGYANFAIRHDFNGILVPSGDINGFADAILSLSLDPEQRRRLGRQARKDIEASHSWHDNIDRILSSLSRHETATRLSG